MLGEDYPGSNDLANTALINALGQLKGKKVDLAVAYGERKQTARLVGDTATSIARAVRSLRHGEIRNAMRDLGISSKRREPRGSNWTNKWLELQYGWKPLLSDVYGAVDALSKRPSMDWNVTARSTKKASRSNTVMWSNDQVGSGSAQQEVKVQVRIDAQPSNEAAISLASTGVTNPAVLAWELLPYSFVVDWFLPVGGYLDSLDAAIGYDNVWVCTSILTRTSWEGKGQSGVFSGVKISGNWYEYKRSVKLGRSVSTGYPIPSFPSFKDPRSLGHMANALALLTNVFRR